MTTQTINRMRELKLSGMAGALEQQLQQVDTFEALPFIERLSLLLEQEWSLRENRKQHRLIRQARFRVNATIEEIDYQQDRNLKREVIARLAQGNWIERKQNLLITGPCGTGKTYLACAIGQAACIREYSVRYFRLSRLLLQLTQAKADGSYAKLLKQLSRTKVLIIDDWGLEPLQPAHRHDLLEILDDRHDSASTIVISQLPLDQWYLSIGDNTLADAILDRLMHNAHKIKLQMKGDSMRKIYAGDIDGT